MLTLSIIDAAAIFDWVIANINYWWVFLLMVIESSFIPFPSEVIVPPAAYLAVTGGNMNVTAVVVVATAGAIVGALVNYLLAIWIGRPLVYKFANSNIGHACLIDEAKVNNAERYFEQHGAISTFIGRLIPAVRQLISIPAGLARMNIGKFIAFTGLGALLWNAVLGALGYWLGSTVPLNDLYVSVEKYNTYLSYFGIIIGLVCVAIIIRNVLKHRIK